MKGVIMKNLLGKIKKPKNIVQTKIKNDDIVIKIKGVENFDDFLEYLREISLLKCENESLRNEIESMKSCKYEFISFVEERLEESKFSRYYDNESREFYPTKEEIIYEKILGSVIALGR